MPGGWDAGAAFPAMKGNVAFLIKDVVLLAASFYFLKQDVVRAAFPEAERHHEREVASLLGPARGVGGWNKNSGSQKRYVLRSR
jgi:hypothetical protein